MPHLPHEQIAREFESILAEEYHLDVAGCRESADWWRFYPDGLSMQGGVHRNDFRVLCTICATDTDCDLERLSTDLNDHNQSIAGAQFIEADCYIHVRSTCRFDELSKTRMQEMMHACMDAGRSPAARRLKSRYQSFD